MSLEVKLLQTIRFERGADAKELESKLLHIESIRTKTIEKFDGNSELFNVNPIQYANENTLLSEVKSIQRKMEDYYEQNVESQ